MRLSRSASSSRSSASTRSCCSAYSRCLTRRSSCSRSTVAACSVSTSSAMRRRSSSASLRRCCKLATWRSSVCTVASAASARRVSASSPLSAARRARRSANRSPSLLRERPSGPMPGSPFGVSLPSAINLIGNLEARPDGANYQPRCPNGAADATTTAYPTAPRCATPAACFQPVRRFAASAAAASVPATTMPPTASLRAGRRRLRTYHLPPCHTTKPRSLYRLPLIRPCYPRYLLVMQAPRHARLQRPQLDEPRRGGLREESAGLGERCEAGVIDGVGRGAGDDAHMTLVKLQAD